MPETLIISNQGPWVLSGLGFGHSILADHILSHGGKVRVREVLVSSALTVIVAVSAIGASPSAASAAANRTSPGASHGLFSAVPQDWTLVPVTEYAPEGSSLAPLNGHIYFSVTGYRIDATPDQLDLVPVDVLAQLQAYTEDVNAKIASGDFVMQEDGTAVTPSPVTAAWSGPHGSVTPHWWGYTIKVDAYLANKIIGGTWTVAGIAAALGVSGVVAAAIGAAAGVMQMCQDKHGAITFYWVGPLPGGGPTCNPFS
jgi:hypothetical protein